MVQAKEERADPTKEEEPVQPPEIFKEQEMVHHLFLTKEANFKITLQYPVLMKSTILYLISGLPMA